MPRIAVLIPVYNAERYLTECLDSVLNQRVPGLEVFCCDDGSADSSRQILADYAQRDSRVHFVTQANAGVVVARNRLLDELPEAFEAFAFLDSDDSVAPGMYAKLAEALERTAADMAECEWGGEEMVITDMQPYLLSRCRLGSWINVWNKLYRRSAVGKLRFREGLAFEEDYFFNYEAHQFIRRKVFVPGHFYNYRDNPSSVTSSLNLRRYYTSTTRRIQLSLSEFWAKGRIPERYREAWLEDLAKDAYRMCLRKNLKCNRNPAERRELFLAAGDFFSELERVWKFEPKGLNQMQSLIYTCCRYKCYGLARVLVAFT